MRKIIPFLLLVICPLFFVDNPVLFPDYSRCFLFFPKKCKNGLESRQKRVKNGVKKGARSGIMGFYSIDFGPALVNKIFREEGLSVFAPFCKFQKINTK